MLEILQKVIGNHQSSAVASMFQKPTDVSIKASSTNYDGINESKF